MITENHAKGKIFWPENRRMTVAITFDFQGGDSDADHLGDLVQREKVAGR